MDEQASSSNEVDEQGGDNNDDSFLNSNLHNSTQKSFNKVSSIDKLNKSHSKSKESKSQANLSHL